MAQLDCSTPRGRQFLLLFLYITLPVQIWHTSRLFSRDSKCRISSNIRRDYIITLTYPAVHLSTAGSHSFFSRPLFFYQSICIPNEHVPPSN